MKAKKATLGPIPWVVPMMTLVQSNNGNQLQHRLISANISAKLFTIPICIGLGIAIGIDVGSVETVLHSIIEPNFIGIGSKYTITRNCHVKLHSPPPAPMAMAMGSGRPNELSYFNVPIGNVRFLPACT